LLDGNLVVQGGWSLAAWIAPGVPDVSDPVVRQIVVPDFIRRYAIPTRPLKVRPQLFRPIQGNQGSDLD
jgi:hypothetical protein